MEPNPFSPLNLVTGGASGTGHMHVVVDFNGEPIWQKGDTNPYGFAITSVGHFFNTPSTTKSYGDLKGRAYITGSRLVVVGWDFAQGSKMSQIGIPTLSAGAYDVIANRISKSKARKQYTGQYLGGMMRFPWIQNILWSTPNVSRKYRRRVRVIGTHISKFGEKELVGLDFTLSNDADILPFVTTLIGRIKDDRYNFQGTSDEERALLDKLPLPQNIISSGPDQLGSIFLPGAWLIMNKTAFAGKISAASTIEVR